MCAFFAFFKRNIFGLHVLAPICKSLDLPVIIISAWEAMTHYILLYKPIFLRNWVQFHRKKKSQLGFSASLCVFLKSLIEQSDWLKLTYFCFWKNPSQCGKLQNDGATCQYTCILSMLMVLHWKLKITDLRLMLICFQVN